MAEARTRWPCSVYRSAHALQRRLRCFTRWWSAFGVWAAFISRPFRMSTRLSPSPASRIDICFATSPWRSTAASRHSTGTAYFSKVPKKQATAADLFHSEGIIPIHDDFRAVSLDGRFPKSLQVMLFESYLQSGRAPAPHRADLTRAPTRAGDGVRRARQPQIWTNGRRSYARRHKLDHEKGQARGHLLRGAFSGLPQPPETSSMRCTPSTAARATCRCETSTKPRCGPLRRFRKVRELAARNLARCARKAPGAQVAPWPRFCRPVEHQ